MSSSGEAKPSNFVQQLSFFLFSLQSFKNKNKDFIFLLFEIEYINILTLSASLGLRLVRRAAWLIFMIAVNAIMVYSYLIALKNEKGTIMATIT